MRIAAIQHDIVWEDPEANFERLAPRIASAASAGARMAVMTEMFSTGFSMNTGKTAEPVDGPSVRFLAEQAREHDLWVGASLPEQPEGMDRPYNTFVLASPTGELHRYRKIHPFTYSREHEHFAAGEEFTTVDVEGLRVSLFVCYDLRFADEFWAVAPDTDLYLVPANWPEPRRRHWSALLRARAIENQAYVVGVNRVGEGDGLRYVGDSAVIDPVGEVLASGAGTEALLITEVHAERVQTAREELPFMPDRR
ncbi:MAG: carbon-nitrogen family hydrolase [Nitriliruptorales bacterium]|nr:carbon-nitrogen family hydrolase [Nitriliruptorales bacterium]